jgi:hypothetical protein
MTGSDETMESRFVAKLQAGKSYRMPHCVIDFLGAESAAALARRLPGRQLGELRSLRPFLATVLDQGLGQSTYSIVLRDAGGRLWHLKGLIEDKETRQVCSCLQSGKRFEFPAVLDDALLAPEKRLERAKPKNTSTAVLWRYLGEWRGTLDADPKAKVEMICHARPDGSGIWREITFHDGVSELPPLPDIAVMEFDRSEGAYLAGSMAQTNARPLVSTWNEKSRTFTTVLPVDDRGLKRVNKATFTREDRIDWKTTTLSQKNEELASSGGHYDRVRGPGDAEKEAPPPTPVSDMQHSPAGHTAAAASAPLPFLPALSELPTVNFSNLGKCPPFRAKIVSLEVSADELVLKLGRLSGADLTIRSMDKGIGSSPMAKALSQLKKDTFYDFPHCIHHPGEAPAGGPATPAMKALEPFVGEWKVRIRDRQGALVETPAKMRYYWSADGKCLWRESVAPTHSILEYTRHDADNGCYVSALELTEDVKKASSTWDAGTRTYTTELMLGSPPGVVLAKGARTFKSPDLVEWSNKQLTSDGTVANESSGTYERIKP